MKNETNFVQRRFYLKCLTVHDDASARILQIEESPGHRYYSHVIEVKEFLKHKFDTLQQLRPRELQLVSLDQNQLTYRKNEVLVYICK